MDRDLYLLTSGKSLLKEDVARWVGIAAGKCCRRKLPIMVFYPDVGAIPDTLHGDPILCEMQKLGLCSTTPIDMISKCFIVLRVPLVLVGDYSLAIHSILYLYHGRSAVPPAGCPQSQIILFHAQTHNILMGSMAEVSIESTRHDQLGITSFRNKIAWFLERCVCLKERSSCERHAHKYFTIALLVFSASTQSQRIYIERTIPYNV